jgi:hypothetical protein
MDCSKSSLDANSKDFSTCPYGTKINLDKTKSWLQAHLHVSLFSGHHVHIDAELCLL